MSQNKDFYREIAVEAARIADSKKAEAIMIYDSSEQGALSYYVLLASAENFPQIKAIEEDISVNLKKNGAYAIYRDGVHSKTWKAADYGGLIVHLFEKQARDFYSLDKIYASCPVIDWREKKPSKKTAVKKTAPRKTPKKPAAVKKIAAKKKVSKTAKKAPNKDRRKKK